MKVGSNALSKNKAKTKGWFVSMGRCGLRIDPRMDEK